MARRNLTDEQRLLVLGRMYERRKKNREQNLKQLSKGQNVLSDVEGSNATAKAIASVAGVNEKTVRRAAEFAKAGDGMVKYRRTPWFHLFQWHPCVTRFGGYFFGNEVSSKSVHPAPIGHEAARPISAGTNPGFRVRSLLSNVRTNSQNVTWPV
jgi:hypothetical protein